MALPNSNWNYPTNIWFGNGRIQDIAAACAQLGMAHPLFVTDEGLVDLDIVSHAVGLLNKHGVKHQVYSEVQGNPTGGNVEHGVALYRQHGHDGVIAFGGGSALDAGKSIALLAGQSRPLWDFEDVGDNWKRADADAIAPVLAIPTTAGTGSEVGRAAVILDEDEQRKKILFHPRMLPSLIISDPELTRDLPATVTAWTGIDALVHAIEAYCAPGFHPMADGIAIEAIRTVFQWLPEAVTNGHNLEARGHMLVAATMGATAFQKGLGSIHSVSHVLGALHNVHHGLANAIVLPYGLKQNRIAIDDRMGHLCRVMRWPGNNTAAVIDQVLALRSQLAIPHQLSELDISAQNAEEIGRLAYADPSTPSNAMPVDAQQLAALFTAAVNGKLDAL